MGLPWRCESGAFLGIFLSFKPDQNNAGIRLLIYTGTRARFYRALSNLSWTFNKLQSLYINVTFPYINYFYAISW